MHPTCCFIFTTILHDITPLPPHHLITTLAMQTNTLIHPTSILSLYKPLH